MIYMYKNVKNGGGLFFNLEYLKYKKDTYTERNSMINTMLFRVFNCSYNLKGVTHE